MIIVVLDPRGKVVCLNAFHMILIWGNLAFPFTAAKEEALWRDEIWRLELLVDDIDPRIHEWIVQGKHIALYGGDDMDWIRRLTRTIMEVATAVGIELELELVYVGKSNLAKEKVKRNIETIGKKKLSHYWTSLTEVWYFWTRLECMLYSKMQQGKKAGNEDIMQQVMTVLSFDGSDQGRATIWFGSTEMALAQEYAFLECFQRLERWEEEAKTLGFVPTLRKMLEVLRTAAHCNRLIIPSIVGGAPERVICADCGKPMEKHFLYRCCED